MKHSLVEWVELRWLQQYAAYPPTRCSSRELSTLILDCELHGVTDPLEFAVNPFSLTCRLDTGNHRVWFLPLLGYTHAPTVCYVSNTDVPSPHNGTHSYPAPELVFGSDRFTGPYWCRISSAIRSVPVR